MPRGEYRPKKKTEREMAVLIFTYKMPSTGPYVSPHRHLPFYETEDMLTEFVEKGWALREGTTRHTGESFACMTYEGAMHFGFPWHGSIPDSHKPPAPQWDANLRKAVYQRLKHEYGDAYVDFDISLVFGVILEDQGLVHMDQVSKETWDRALSRGHK